MFSGPYKMGLAYLLFIWNITLCFELNQLPLFLSHFFSCSIHLLSCFFFIWVSTTVLSIHFIMLKPCWNVDARILLIVNLCVFTICKRTSILIIKSVHVFFKKNPTYVVLYADILCMDKKCVSGSFLNVNYCHTLTISGTPHHTHTYENVVKVLKF